jgi:argininosuccinate lyase
MTTVLGNVRVNCERTRAAASVGFLNATDLADYLVRKGLAFRIAHELVGRVVNHAMAKGIALEEIALEDYQQFSPLFSEDVYEALKLETSLANKPAHGGTSPERVRQALATATTWLKG